MNLLPENQKKNQTLTLRDRETLELDGVSDVRGFDESTVYLDTVCGRLTVEGEGLHITHLALEEGRVALTGRIGAIYYADEAHKAKGGFFARIFG